MAGPVRDEQYPCSLTVYIPFPTHRLAESACRTLSVDEELSTQVTNHLSLTDSVPNTSTSSQHDSGESSVVNAASLTAKLAARLKEKESEANDETSQKEGTSKVGLPVLRVHYKATTNRMLRVAVNGFFESLGVIVQVMEELDVDVLHEKGIEGLEGVQGVEQGMTGTTITGA